MSSKPKIGGVSLIILICGIIGAVGAVTGIVEIAFHPLRSWLWAGPYFQFICEGETEPDSHMYEVTAALYWEPPEESNSDESNINIVVAADYYGHHIKGPVHVKIRKFNGQNIRKTGWVDFENEHTESRSFRLTIRDLFDYSGIPPTEFAPDKRLSVPFGKKRGEFNINIVHNNRIIANTTIQVVNAPWLHSAYLEKNPILEGEDLRGYVTVTNHGSASQFNVEVRIHRISPHGNSKVNDTLVMDSQGWWPSRTWPMLDKMNFEIRDTVKVGEEVTIPVTLPADIFKARHVYILEVCAVKKLPHLQFLDGDWISSQGAYRARNCRQFLVVIVLARP